MEQIKRRKKRQRRESKVAAESDNEEDEEEAALRQAIEEEEAANEQKDEKIAAQNVILAVSEREEEEPVFAPSIVDARIQRIDEQIAMIESEKKKDTCYQAAGKSSAKNEDAPGQLVFTASIDTSVEGISAKGNEGHCVEKIPNEGQQHAALIQNGEATRSVYADDAAADKNAVRYNESHTSGASDSHIGSKPAREDQNLEQSAHGAKRAKPITSTFPEDVAASKRTAIRTEEKSSSRAHTLDAPEIEMKGAESSNRGQCALVADDASETVASKLEGIPSFAETTKIAPGTVTAGEVQNGVAGSSANGERPSSTSSAIKVPCAGSLALQEAEKRILEMKQGENADVYLSFGPKPVRGTPRERQTP